MAEENITEETTVEETAAKYFISTDNLKAVLNKIYNYYGNKSKDGKIKEIYDELSESITTAEDNAKSYTDDKLSNKIGDLGGSTVKQSIDSAISTAASDATSKANAALNSAKSYTDEKVTSVFRYKGSVPTYNDLPENASKGDVYNVEDTGMNFAWDGSAWDPLGGSFAIAEASDAEIDALPL